MLQEQRNQRLNGALWQQLESLAANFQKINTVESKAYRKKGPFQRGKDQANKLAKAAALVGDLWEARSVAVAMCDQTKR